VSDLSGNPASAVKQAVELPSNVSPVMAARIRAMDWSPTPIGPIENWPVSLRLAVDLCLNSRFPMHVWWGPELIYVYNDAHIPILGKRHPNALGRPAESVWAEVWQILGPQVEAVMVRGESTWNEKAYVVLERQGFREDIWFTWSYSPIRDEAGRISGLICISMEETARVLAEKERDRLEEQRKNKAHETQAVLAAIVESSNDAIIGKTLDDTIATWNGGAERIFGYTSAEAVGRHISMLIPADRLHEEADFRRRLERGNRIQYFETLRVAKDGRKLDVAITVSPIRDSAGTIVGASKIIRDVSERKRAEEVLRESEGRLRAIVETAVDGIITIDEQGLVTSMNPAAVRLFGYSSEEVIGKNVNVLMPAPYHLEHDGYLKNYRDTGVKKIIGIGREVVGRRKNGTQFPMDLAVSETLLGERRIFTGIVRNIGERKKAAADLSRQAEELARSNVELERFAYVASHDLQEPMRTVQSFTQLLQRKLGDSLKGDAEEYLRFVVGGVQRMQRLIQDLLAYSRVSSQGAAFAASDCKEIVSGVLQSLQASIESNQANVTVDPLPVVIGDATQLGQVFQNLLINAIKFHRQRKPMIHVSVNETPVEWIFSVADNGIGIASEYFERIFIIFQRLHTIEEYGGTGIGLAVCKKIVERHGGRIWVESVPGEGSTFYFSISKREKSL
jgi:PAS domain S-box-containing protein